MEEEREVEEEKAEKGGRRKNNGCSNAEAFKHKPQQAHFGACTFHGSPLWTHLIPSPSVRSRWLLMVPSVFCLCLYLPCSLTLHLAQSHYSINVIKTNNNKIKALFEWGPQLLHLYKKSKAPAFLKVCVLEKSLQVPFDHGK